MSTLHLRNALALLESLLSREDVSADVKRVVQNARAELIQAQDELVWTRSRVREAFNVLEELVELLGVEMRAAKVRIGGGVLEDYVKMSPHIEAVVGDDGRVRVEKVAVIRGEK